MSSPSPDDFSAFLTTPQGAVFFALAILGAFAIFVGAKAAVSTAFAYFLQPKFSYAKYKGKWAVVTGASAGLGAAFATKLAKRGLNVVLLARSVDKLETVAASVRAAGAEARIVPFDFASATPSDYQTLAGVLAPLDIAVLVNNVGVNVPFPMNLVDTAEEDVERILAVNVGATTRMTRMVVPGMVERKSGVVFFLSSAAGTVSPSPMLSLYGATKAFADSMAIALSAELAGSGVVVHSLIPFYVVSEMSKFRRPTFTVPSPEDFVEKALGMAGGDPRLNPHWPHAAMATGLGMMPPKQAGAYVQKLHAGINKRAKRKMEAAAKEE